MNLRIGVLFGRCVFRFEDEKTQDPSPKDPPPPPKHEDATLHSPAERVSLAQAISISLYLLRVYVYATRLCEESLAFPSNDRRGSRQVTAENYRAGVL